MSLEMSKCKSKYCTTVSLGDIWAFVSCSLYLTKMPEVKQNYVSHTTLEIRNDKLTRHSDFAEHVSDFM